MSSSTRPELRELSRPDKKMGSGTVREMILVNPDAFTLYNGSMCSNSATIGDRESYIGHDLVAFIDIHYRWSRISIDC